MSSPLRISYGDPTPWMEWQEPESGLPETVAANDDNRDPHFSPLPSGLLSHSFPFVPIGLSAKEVARMHAEALHSQPSITHAAMDESRSQLQSPQSPATEQRAMTLF